MVSFCGNHTGLSPAWVDHGLSRCFIETLSSSILFGLITIFGGIELLFYRKYSNPTDRRLKPKSCLYKLQIFATLLITAVHITFVILRKFLIGDKEVYPYMIMCTCFLAVAWLLSIRLIVLERNEVLPSIPTRGHGLVLLAFWTLSLAHESLAFISWKSPHWWWGLENTSERVEFGIWLGRFLLCFLLFILGFKAPGVPGKNYHLLINANQDQAEALLNDADQGPETSSAWSGFFKKCVMMWPFIWPKRNFLLQCRVVFCFLILAAGRGVNLFVPIYYKKIVNSLTFPVNSGPVNSTANSRDTTTISPPHAKLDFRWDFIVVYVTLKFLQGGGFGSMGLLNNMRTFFWIRVQQYTTKEVSVQLYEHLHGLSLKWHLNRKTGEVLRVMDRGTNSINSVLSTVVFNLVPTVADIIIAIIYFISAFNAWFGLIVFVAMLLYLIATIGVTEWRTKYRREMNKLDNLRNAKGVDSLLNFETVKYYGAEKFEVGRYEDAINDYQKAEWVSIATLNILNTVQNVIITSGLLAGSLLCAWYVVDGFSGLTVGDYVLFASYIVQLYGPLNFFGTYYRMLQQSFIDMENMFDLLREKQDVKDVAGAPDLVIHTGQLEFDDVCFHYQPEKPILKNISFTIPPGKTFALVGPSGSGKSTIIRLLFRFYDITGGAIRFDGQDIARVTQNSLRHSIGVVPQDTVLFNSDIKYNIRYGRVTADDDQVYEAASAADIHQRILTFPDQYETIVGERGLKLSGGEKQRVAIARTILKAPAVVLLDEATSALDTQTERNIQSSLSKICENRTTLIVAHRLSTIIHADLILVLKEGEIVERGSHESLLEKEGMYADMWTQQQTKAEDENGDGTAEDDTS